MRLRGTFVVSEVEEVGGKFAVEMVRRDGIGNLRVVLDEEPEDGEEFEFLLSSSA